MVLYKVFSQEHRIRYLAHPCSTAVLFQISCLILTFLPPLFTSYFTSGFYLKELTYSEQPNVTFLQEYNLIIDSSSSLIFSSSDARLNNFSLPSYSPSTLITDSPVDINGDGITDQQTITLSINLPQSISGATINLWLIYQYALIQYPLINMETLGLVSLNVPSSLSTDSTVTVYGQLRFQQRQPVLGY
jgi:transmembrane protein 231